MLQTLEHTLEIGDHVTYIRAGEPRTGIIRYFSSNRRRVFIKDDIDKEMHEAPAPLVNFMPLETTG